MPFRARHHQNGSVFTEEDPDVSLLRLDSDEFDVALVCQDEAATTSEADHDGDSIRTVIIHDDAVFLESTMEITTWSAVLSSEAKAPMKDITAYQVDQIIAGVENERNALYGENQALLAVLSQASQDAQEYRVFIEQGRRRKEDQEQKLNAQIVDLQAECGGKSWQMELLRQTIAEKEEMEQTLREMLEDMAGNGFKVVPEEVDAELKSMQS